jgi:hypothetical protein
MRHRGEDRLAIVTPEVSVSMQAQCRRGSDAVLEYEQHPRLEGRGRRHRAGTLTREHSAGQVVRAPTMMADGHSAPRFTTTLFACLPAFMSAVYPLAVVIGTNIAVLPISTAIIARDIALALGITGLLMWASRPLAPELVPRGIWVSSFTLLFCSYGVLAPLAASLGTVVNTASRKVAILYTLASIVIATLTVRPRTVRRRYPLALNVVAAVMLSLNVYAAGTVPRDGRWREAAAALTDPDTVRHSRAPRAEARDIYYIVLDGLGRSDILRQYYGLNLDRFVEFLKNRGFFVAERAHSNYSQTYLSLASTLNMNYLDDLARVVGKDAEDRRPLEYLIRSNALMKFARDAGYEVIFIGSDYEATKRVDRADVCICEQGARSNRTGRPVADPAHCASSCAMDPRRSPAQSPGVVPGARRPSCISQAPVRVRTYHFAASAVRIWAGW